MTCGNRYVRHWFSYYGEPGTSAPCCQRCLRVANPNHDASRDPHTPDRNRHQHPV